MSQLTHRRLLLVALAVLFAAECERRAHSPPSATEAGRRDDSLARIRERGALRVLVPRRDGEAFLPRSGSPLEVERDLAQAFARDLGLDVEWVYVDRFAELIPSLLAGEGDLIAGNFTVTPERARRVAFSVPVAYAREQLVTRGGERPPESPAELAGRRIAVRRWSSFWNTARTLRASHPGIEIEPVPETLSTAELLDGVARGEFDVTIADSNLMAAVSAYRDDVQVAFDLSDERILAWSVHPAATELRKAVDGFLTQARLGARRRDIALDDLDGIRERKVLRVLTRNAASTYFIWRGQLMGFEYDLAREFARQQGLRLEIIVPPSHEDLFRWLREGKGDLVAAGVTASAERAEREGVAFSQPVHWVTQTVVARPHDTGLEAPADLAGRTLVVRRSSGYRSTLEGLIAAGIPLELASAPEDLETEDIIARVASREYDLTLADSHVAQIEVAWRDDVRAAFSIGDPQPLGWAVRRDSRQLLAALDEFLLREYRGVFYNLTLSKYFESPHSIRRHVEFRAERAGVLSPYDEPVRKYASRYGFDWRLIVAQMYQESRFDPAAASFAGALGLLQVLPRTARQFGFSDLTEPDTGVHAGVRYLAWVRDRFEPDLPVDDRNWLALAAYNAGWGHVADARRLARERGWDADRWFGHLERAMLLLSRPEIARGTRFGYCRCGEPVRYVREIRDRYRAYVGVDVGQGVATGLLRFAKAP